jgi:3'(2'), 5'-bisphosphate nucleotidase
VHVALWQSGQPSGEQSSEPRGEQSGQPSGRLVAGAVALPAEDVVFATAAPPIIPGREPGPIRLAVSRSRPPEFVTAIAATLGAELVPMGSAGVKCASVWRGQADAYVHAGGQYEWDSAAPVAVARSCGLHTSRIDGSELVYNRPDPLLPDLLVCRPEFAPQILSAIAAHVQFN